MANDASFAALQRRCNAYPRYRQLVRHPKDVLGRKWAYGTFPGLPWPQETPVGKGSGPHCFYRSLDEVKAALDADDKILAIIHPWKEGE